MALFDEPMRTMYLLREQSDRHVRLDVRNARFGRSVETCNVRDHEEAVHMSIEALYFLLGGLGRTNDGKHAAMIGSARDVMRNRRRRRRRELERE
jgi:hypothetical protein